MIGQEKVKSEKDSQLIGYDVSTHYMAKSQGAPKVSKPLVVQDKKTNRGRVNLLLLISWLCSILLVLVIRSFVYFLSFFSIKQVTYKPRLLRTTPSIFFRNNGQA